MDKIEKLLEKHGLVYTSKKPYMESSYTSGGFKLTNKIIKLDNATKIYFNLIQLLTLEDYYLEANFDYFIKQIEEIGEENIDNVIKASNKYKNITLKKFKFKNIILYILEFINNRIEDFINFVEEYMANYTLSLFTTGLKITISKFIPEFLIEFGEYIFSSVTYKIVSRAISFLTGDKKSLKKIISEMNTVIFDIKRLSEDSSNGVLFIDLNKELRKKYYPNTFRMLLANINLSQIRVEDRFSVDELREMGIPFYESLVINNEK